MGLSLWRKGLFLVPVERVEKLQQGYEFSGEQLLMGLPELLRGKTLLWYRNNRASWTIWEEFRIF